MSSSAMIPCCETDRPNEGSGGWREAERWPYTGEELGRYGFEDHPFGENRIHAFWDEMHPPTRLSGPCCIPPPPPRNRIRLFHTSNIRRKVKTYSAGGGLAGLRRHPAYKGVFEDARWWSAPWSTPLARIIPTRSGASSCPSPACTTACPTPLPGFACSTTPAWPSNPATGIWPGTHRLRGRRRPSRRRRVYPVRIPTRP